MAVPVRPRLRVRRRGLVSSLFFLCGFVRVGCGVVQRVVARQTYLRVNKCAELLRNDENILKSSAQTSLADALNLSSKPSVFSAHLFLSSVCSRLLPPFDPGSKCILNVKCADDLFFFESRVLFLRKSIVAIEEFGNINNYANNYCVTY